MAMTSIGIDIRDADKNGSGKSRYALEITQALLETAPPTFHFYLFTKTANPFFLSSPRIHQVLVEGRGLFWHLNLKRYLRRHPVDFFLAPTSFIYPALAPSRQKTAIVVHDLIAFLHRKGHAWFPTFVERLTLPLALKKCRFIICVSKHTALDLHSHFPETQKKPLVIAPPAVSPHIHRVSSQSLDLPKQFLLTVGTLSPRKNLHTLFAAFADLSQTHKNLCIVVAGAKGWKTTATQRKIPAVLKPRIHFLGRVSDSELCELYSRAEIMVFPSFYEGFGIPILEAMSCGCPVVCSNTSSLPEVAGDAALFVDPKNPKTLAEAIKFMLKSKVAELYRKRGLKRAQTFSWKESARQILAQVLEPSAREA